VEVPHSSLSIFLVSLLYYLIWTMNSLVKRLQQGVVFVGEGYLFELERRGYVQIGPYVPVVVLDHPEAVRELHREFLRAGSDVIEAFTYYANRDKMKLIGRESELEELNRKALQLAKEVAAEGGALVAGNISNTNVYDPNIPSSIEEARSMFQEQVDIALQAGVDFIIAETIDFLGEAMLALEIIKKAGLPAVVTLAIHTEGNLREGIPIEDACLKLYEAGATVVGLNCARGPATMLPMLKKIREKVPKECYVAALPVPFKTTPEKPTFQSLCNESKMYMELEPHTHTRFEMAQFAKDAAALGVNYIGVCCGGAPYHLRAMAEALGKKVPSSKFSADLSRHFAYGTHESLRKHNLDYKDKL